MTAFCAAADDEELDPWETRDDLEIDLEHICDCGRPANDYCGFCGQPLCYMCFECGAGFCHNEHTKEQINDYARRIGG